MFAKIKTPPALLALLILAAVANTHAAKSQSDNWTFNLYFENDLFAETDQNYTNGIRISWVSPDLTDYIRDPALPNWVRSANKRLRFFHPPSKRIQRNLVFSLGQTIYTPEDIASTAIVADDRPYAGWLYTSFAYHGKSDKKLDTIEIQLGLVGPAALGREAQDFIHDLRGFDKFQGWDNQLENELGLLLLYEHKRKLSVQIPHDGGLGHDLIVHAGAALGNVGSYLNFGGEVRLGWLIPNDFGTSAVRPGGDNSAPDANWDPRLSNPGQWGFHVFASFDTRLVARDIFLDGNSFENSHRVDREPVVADLALGISTVFSGVKLSFARVFRSKEFKTQDSSHAYGSLSVSFSF